MIKKTIYFLMAIAMTVSLAACSSDDEELTGKAALCHAWYFHDEMPKNFMTMMVFTPDGRVEGAQLFYDEGRKLRKHITNNGHYLIEDEVLTVQWEDYPIPFIFAYAVEKSDGGYVLRTFDVRDKERSTNEIWGFYSTSAELDNAYKQAEEYIPAQ